MQAQRGQPGRTVSRCVELTGIHFNMKRARMRRVPGIPNHRHERSQRAGRSSYVERAERPQPLTPATR